VPAIFCPSWRSHDWFGGRTSGFLQKLHICSHNDDPERICTSIVERSNLGIRMGTRRFTRLTNALSKKWENHWASVAFWFAFYNFCRVRKSLHCTPAREAKIADHTWSVRELLQA
jgi:hypothetical protein